MKKQTCALAKRAVATVLVCSLALAVSPVVSAKTKAKKPTLNKTKKSLYIGETFQLKVKKNGCTIKSTTWSSNKKTVATVTKKKGKVFAEDEGTAKITAKVKAIPKGKKKAKTYNLKCTITVLPLEDQPLMGEWETCDSPGITEDDKAIINSVLNNTNDGVTYEPVALLATQLVQGLNYRYLCRKSVIAPEAKTTYSVVEVNVDTDGNVTLHSAVEGISGIYDTTREACPAEVIPGGWARAENPAIITDGMDYSKIIENASAELVGATYKPVALVETQASALQFLLICEYEIPGTDPGDNLEYAFVTVAVSPDFTSAEIKDIQAFYDIMAPTV